MEKQRIRYYDLLRIFSFSLVTLYHMLVQLNLSGIIVPIDAVARYYQNANMHIATLAVALFFMLSGAGLTISAEKGLDLKRYYKGRFRRLLIPFYVAVLGYYIACCAAGKLPYVFTAGTPAWRYVFTVLGLDEWVSMHNYATFSLGIGEWFLGALIILSALFPLLRHCMNRCPKAMFAICTAVYVCVICNYHSTVAMHMNLLLKGYEFVLGMYLGKYCRRFPTPWQAVAVPVAAIFFMGWPVLKLNGALKILLSALSVFAACSALEPVLQKRKLSFLEKTAQFSYPLFLAHHIVIYVMTPRFKAYYTGRASVAAFFLIELAVIVVLAVIVKQASGLVVRLIDRHPKSHGA